MDAGRLMPPAGLTPLQRATRLYDDELQGLCSVPSRAANIERIRVALIEASQFELEKRRAVELELEKAQIQVAALTEELHRVVCTPDIRPTQYLRWHPPEPKEQAASMPEQAQHNCARHPVLISDTESD